MYIIVLFTVLMVNWFDKYICDAEPAWADAQKGFSVNVFHNGVTLAQTQHVSRFTFYFSIYNLPQ